MVAPGLAVADLLGDAALLELPQRVPDRGEGDRDPLVALDRACGSRPGAGRAARPIAIPPRPAGHWCRVAAAARRRAARVRRTGGTRLTLAATRRATGAAGRSLRPRAARRPAARGRPRGAPRRPSRRPAPLWRRVRGPLASRRRNRPRKPRAAPPRSGPAMCSVPFWPLFGAPSLFARQALPHSQPMH